jgi:hypothetical protein
MTRSLSCTSSVLPSRQRVSLRTPLGQESIWQNYKAVSLQGQVCAAFFQENELLLGWTNRQPLARVVTCLGDGHEGIWNLITQIGDSFQRREVLEWYHLIENLNKVGGRTNCWEESKVILFVARRDRFSLSRV